MEWWNELQTRWEELFGQAGVLGDALLAVVVTIVAYALYRLLRLVHGGAAIRIASLLRVHPGPVRIQSQELLSADQITGMFVAAWHFFGIGLFLVGFYVYLQTVFGLFAATQSLADRLLDNLIDVSTTLLSSVLEFLPDLVVLVFLFFVGRWLVRLLGLFFEGVQSGTIRIPGFYAEFAEPTHKIVRVVLIAFLAIMAFPYLPGSSSPAFQGVSIFLGVLVSLGSSGAVANFISGLTLTYMRAFQIGDRVRIADAEGDVEERTAFVTRVRTPKNVDISIPNAMVLANHIINFSARARTSGVILHTTVTIGYDVPWGEGRGAAAGRRRGHLAAREQPRTVRAPAGARRLLRPLRAECDHPGAQRDVEHLLGAAPEHPGPLPRRRHRDRLAAPLGPARRQPGPDPGGLPAEGLQGALLPLPAVRSGGERQVAGNAGSACGRRPAGLPVGAWSEIPPPTTDR